MRLPALRRLVRLLVGIVAVTPLFAVSFEAHVGPAPHADVPTASWLAPGAQHPDQPHHVETSKLVHADACPACILQMQSACDGIAHAPSLAAPDCHPAPLSLRKAPPLAQSRPAAFSRGPPAA